ncbi:peptidase S28, partial [Kipferlia bialata]
LEPIAAYANLIKQQTTDTCLVTNYQAMVQQLQNTDPTSPSLSSRSWTYQTCTEEGFFQVADSSVPWSQYISLDYFDNICQNVFGLPLVPDTEHTNSHYGSDYPRATNIFYANGSVDPWHVLSVLEDIPGYEETQPHVLMTGTSHCADMYMPKDNDLPCLAETRNLQLQYLKQWLGFD